MILPINLINTIIEKNISNLNIKFVTTSLKTIKDLINTKQNNYNIKSKVGIYKIHFKNIP